VGETVKGKTRNCIVDGSDVRRICDNPGEFAFREGLQAVTAKRGTASHPQEAGNSLFDFANAIKVLNPDPTKPLTTERFITLVKEPGELRDDNNQQPTASSHIDAEGNKQQLAPGKPIVVKWVQRESGVIMSITS